MSGADSARWLLDWPAGADRVEQWDGALVFELRGSGKSAWDERDVAAAERCYPAHLVHLDDSNTLLIVEPPTAVVSR